MCLCSIKYDVVRALNEFGAMISVQLAKASRSGQVGSVLGGEVAPDFVRHADVAKNYAKNVLVEFSGADQLDRKDA